MRFHSLFVAGWEKFNSNVASKLCPRKANFISFRSGLDGHVMHRPILSFRAYSCPGQASAYKFGELKIRAMRRKVENEFGAKIDVREFHDVVLRNDAVSLSA